MGNNGFTQTFADGAALTAAELTTGYQSLKLDISNTDQMTTGSTSGQFLKSNGSGIAASFGTPPDPIGPSMIRNYGLAASATSGILKVWIKDNSLTDPTSTSAVDIPFSTYGTTTATYTNIQVTSALFSTVVSSATLGVVGTSAQPVFVYAVKNGSAAVLGFSARSDLDNGIPPSVIQMTVGADSQSSIYSTLASGTYQVRLLGSVTVAHNSAGAWQSPTKVSISNNVDLNDTKTWEAITSSTATFSNNAANNVSSRMTATGANNIATLITRATGTTVTAGGVAIADQGGSQASTTATYADVTNLSATITTSGRPVKIEMICGGGSIALSVLTVAPSASDNTSMGLRIQRDGSTLTSSQSNLQGTFNVPPSYHHIDTPAAGTYTYKVQFARSAGNGTVTITRARLVVYEL